MDVMNNDSWRDTSADRIRTERHRKKVEFELSPIEKLLLPVTLTSHVQGVNRMIYVAIRKYEDLSVATGASLGVLVSRYFHSEIVTNYLNGVKHEMEKTGKLPTGDSEENTLEDTTSKEGLLKQLINISKETNSDNVRVEVGKAIATIKGYTRQQGENKVVKNVYTPMTCYECPLYKEQKEQLKQEENDNS